MDLWSYMDREPDKVLHQYLDLSLGRVVGQYPGGATIYLKPVFL